MWFPHSLRIHLRSIVCSHVSGNTGNFLHTNRMTSFSFLLSFPHHHHHHQTQKRGRSFIKSAQPQHNKVERRLGRCVGGVSDIFQPNKWTLMWVNALTLMRGAGLWPCGGLPASLDLPDGSATTSNTPCVSCTAHRTGRNHEQVPGAWEQTRHCSFCNTHGTMFAASLGRPWPRLSFFSHFMCYTSTIKAG